MIVISYSMPSPFFHPSGAHGVGVLFRPHGTSVQSARGPATGAASGRGSGAAGRAGEGRGR